MKRIFTALFLFFALYTQAQNSADVRRAWTLVIENGDTLLNAYGGGLNNPQFSTIDLNNDGTEDLFVFDRVPYGYGEYFCNRLPFINRGTAGVSKYVYAPEYENYFPASENFILLRDYNCDGIKDVFSFSSGSIAPLGILSVRVMKGYYDNGHIAFSVASNKIFLPSDFGPVNLLVQNPDLADFNDMDGDGDIDILNFNQFGGWVEYFRNYSQERGYGCDSLLYEFEDDCWGRFFEPTLTNTLDLSTGPDSCARYANWTPRDPRHAGSCVTTLDMNNDGAREVLLGDISFNNAVMAYNGGTPDTAWMSSQDDAFPSNTLSVNLGVMPAAFHEDIDNDGARDLLFAPNAMDISENRRCAWLYKNIGTDSFPEFSYRQSDFLVNTMIDLGTDAQPAFFDENNDGLLDLVIGYSFTPLSSGDKESSLYLYRNIGTATEPVFELADNNYANLRQLTLNPSNAEYYTYSPCFGDLDGDGDKDMVVGMENGGLLYLKNEGGTGPAAFNSIQPNFQGINVGKRAAPQLVDIDLDGKLDLLVGERFGNVNYYKNTGTTGTPNFTALTNQYFGMLDARGPYNSDGHSQVKVINVNGNYSVFLGTFAGRIDRYVNMYSAPGVINTTFTRVDSAYGNIDVNYHAAFDVADINADGKLDYIVGCNRGGVILYSEGVLGVDPLHLTATETPISKAPVCKVFPNPTSTSLHIDFNIAYSEQTQILLYDMYGHLLLNTSTRQGATDLDLSTFASGVYLMTIVRAGEVVQAEKVVKI